MIDFFCEEYLLMITRSLGQQLCHTKFLIERDCLSTAMMRIGAGFSPPTVLADAKNHLKNIEHIIKQLEDLAHLPKNQIVAQDYQHFQRNCCGRD